MKTTFEIVVAGETAEYARQAAQEAFREIDRLEGDLSRFIESSDISRINRLGAREPVRIGVDTLECLKTAAQIWRETGGAFDVTIGAITASSRTPDGAPGAPGGAGIAEDRAPAGMGLVEFHEDTFCVRLKAEGILLDLGGIGKGFALDKALEILQDWSIGTVLIHGGESSVLGAGTPPGGDGWPVSAGGGAAQPGAPETRVILRDKALSGSGTRVKGSHIIDPRTVRPVEGKTAAWACCGSAAIADALSTAFMVMPPSDVERFCREHPDTGAMLLVERGGHSTLTRLGHWSD